MISLAKDDLFAGAILIAEQTRHLDGREWLVTPAFRSKMYAGWIMVSSPDPGEVNPVPVNGFILANIPGKCGVQLVNEPDEAVAHLICGDRIVATLTTPFLAGNGGWGQKGPPPV